MTPRSFGEMMGVLFRLLLFRLLFRLPQTHIHA